MLENLSLKRILRRKNPYLFRALGNEVASDIVEQILHAFISSSDETIFGDAFFEPIALIVSRGKVADAGGVDFVIETPRRYLAIALKSGPNIFNASQKRRQNQEFQELRSRLYKIHKQFDALLGHAYGRRRADPSGKWIYRERSGQAFWAEITGDPNFYLKLIRLMRDIPAKHKKRHRLMRDIPAKHKKRQTEEWGAAVNRFTVEFANDFCFPNGRINWDQLVEFVSRGDTEPRLPSGRKQ